jgi:hypothetical protein
MYDPKIKYRVNEQGMIVEEINELNGDKPSDEVNSQYLSEPVKSENVETAS